MADEKRQICNKKQQCKHYWESVGHLQCWFSLYIVNIGSKGILIKQNQIDSRQFEMQNYKKLPLNGCFIPYLLNINMLEVYWFWKNQSYVRKYTIEETYIIENQLNDIISPGVAKEI